MFPYNRTIKMARYFIYLSYNGANYCGWQIQPNGMSVQEMIQDKLSILLRSITSIVGAGRTDAGVHARMMAAHFDTDREIETVDLTDRLNRMLPFDIAIHNIRQVKDDAHARFDAKSRLYRYYTTFEKDPFLHPFFMKLHKGLDIEMMNKCANILFEYKDFTSFSKLHTDVKTNNCDIKIAQWEQNDQGLIFTIKADRFLRNMVRSIVGTLLEAGRGKINEEGIRQIIEAKDRSAAGTSAPAHALFLEEIEYDSDIFIV